MHARLRASMGMCAAHTRRLIEDIGDGHIVTTVMRQAVLGALQHLGGDDPPGACPACEAVSVAAGRAAQVVADGLTDPGHARLYNEHTGLCLPHVALATRTSKPAELELLVRRLIESLRAADGQLLIETVGGVDRDAPRRRARRGALPASPSAQTTVAELWERLAVDSCPVCLSAGSIERDYVRWFVERSRERDTSIRNDPGELCARHLHDVALADPGVAADAAQRQRAARRGELARLLDALSEPAPTGRQERRVWAGKLEHARAQFTGEHYCSACHARSEIERSQLALVAAALALRPVHERYVDSHGLCARHALKLRHAGDALPVLSHARARLGVLGWELHETARKYAWACRHEVPGPERDAWVRAMAQIDGGVFEGGPAPRQVP